MSWKNTIKKAKWQGPPEWAAGMKVGFHDLTLTIKVINGRVEQLDEILEQMEVDDLSTFNLRMLSRSKNILNEIIERIDDIDEQVKEQQKYAGDPEVINPKMNEKRLDSNAQWGAGTKWPKGRVMSDGTIEIQEED